ncbi:MAG: hypothetical protein K9J06_12415 [Flavobacteriales bacterium]|nr:hypothetical protein [Flavobacteriales bacterium]
MSPRSIVLTHLLAVCMLSSCAESSVETLTFDAAIADSSRSFIISNSGQGDVTFTIGLNGRLFGSMDEVALAIDRMPEAIASEPWERKAWRFVMEHLANRNPLTEETWQHDPLIMLNSIGFGRCDDLASVLSRIWQHRGRQSRVWQLGGHVVPEVNVNGRWQMYDPSLGVYYLNDDSDVAGVEELAQHPELVHAPHCKLQPRTGQWFLHYRRAYSKEVANLYASMADNFMNPWFDEGTDLHDMLVQLPSGATMVFPVRFPDTLMVDGLFGNRWMLGQMVRYTLPSNWNGILRLPFHPVRIHGSGHVALNGQSYPIGSAALTSHMDAFSDARPSLTISDSKGKIELYCLMNLHAFNRSGRDRLTIRSTELNSIGLSSGTEQRVTDAWAYDPQGVAVSVLAYDRMLRYRSLPSIEQDSAGLTTHSLSELGELLARLSNEDTTSGAGKKSPKGKWGGLVAATDPGAHALLGRQLQDSGQVALMSAILTLLPLKDVVTVVERQAAKRDH